MATGGQLDIESMVAKPTWKQILMELILTERIDPWNIDICIISDRFLAKVREMKKLDLLLPANVILAASILLRYKSSFLKLYDPQPVQETLPVVEEFAAEEMPQLMISARIPPKRQISLDELTQEIERVIKYENNVYVPKHKGGIEETINFTLTQEDIEKKMDDVYERIKANADETGWTMFSNIIRDYERRDVVYALLSILHLTQRELVDIKQDQLFGELFIHLNGKSREN
jgi:segregation and condensation protein A